MSNGIWQRTPTGTLIRRLRLMADSGGMLTKDRIRTVIEAADRIEEQEQVIHGHTETCRKLAHQVNVLQKGGDADEVH